MALEGAAPCERILYEVRKGVLWRCQTLRYCDGREREKYCTLLAECRDGVPAATGFTW